jgi:flagellar hook-associated protein 2
MAIRITGLNSGLDTESIISALVSSYNYKTEKYKKAQTKLSWKQDAWKTLNTKVYSLYKSVGNLRLSTAYNLKSATSSDSTKASVSASSNAVNGTYSVQVTSLAKAGYLTGGRLDSGTTGSTTLSSLGYTGGDATISVGTGDSRTDISVNGDTTISQVVTQLKQAGVNASYDETNRRIYVSSTESGKDNDFTLTGADSAGTDVLKALKLNVASASSTAEYRELAAYSSMSADDMKTIRDNKVAATEDTADKKKQNAYYQSAVSYANASAAVNEVSARGTDADATLLKALVSVDTAGKYVDNDGNIYTYNSTSGKYTTNKDLTGGTYDEITQTYTLNGNSYTGGVYADGIYHATIEVEKDTVETDGNGYTKASDKLDSLARTFGLSTDVMADDGNVTTDTSALDTFKKNLNTVKSIAEEAELNGAEQQSILNDVNAALAGGTVDSLVAGYESTIATNETAIAANDAVLAADSRITADMTDADIAAFKDKADYAQETVQKIDAGQMDYSDGATRVDAQDAVIYVNGAEYTGTSNTFSINGLTITANAVTGTSYDATESSAITATVSTDTQGIYDKVKDFLSQYNALINEMTSLYNADSAKGYDPLTDDEKDAMSDTEIETWETKIKSSLLRRDDTLSSLISSMTSAMSKGYEVNGKNYYLSSFGIKTLGYFNAAENEQNAYHIDGDEDDSATSGNTDKLMTAIISDPESVVSFMQQLTSGLYDAIGNKMKTSTLSSTYTVYNDKEMASEYSDYTDTIKKWEEKLEDKEDYYYSKFSAMETALAKLNSSSSALSGLFS